jgi:hypothetical protein
VASNHHRVVQIGICVCVCLAEHYPALSTRRLVLGALGVALTCARRCLLSCRQLQVPGAWVVHVAVAGLSHCRPMPVSKCSSTAWSSVQWGLCARRAPQHCLWVPQLKGFVLQCVGCWLLGATQCSRTYLLLHVCTCAAAVDIQQQLASVRPPLRALLTPCNEAWAGWGIEFLTGTGVGFGW